MIKETVDAVRVAEMEADKVVATAKDNAMDKKAQVKTKAEEYRANEMNRAKMKADSDMEQTKTKGEEYDRAYNEKIDRRVEELRAVANQKKDKAISAVIDALI